MVQWLTNLTRNHEVAGLIPGLSQWVKDPGIAVSCGVGHRRGSDPTLLWLRRRALATAPIRPLAWEPPYAAGAAQEIATTTTTTKRQKTKKKKKKKVLEPALRHSEACKAGWGLEEPPCLVPALPATPLPRLV